MLDIIAKGTQKQVMDELRGQGAAGSCVNPRLEGEREKDLLLEPWCWGHLEEFGTMTAFPG